MSAAVMAFTISPLLPQNARAGRELSEYEYSLRFPAAVSRFASYGDVAALGGAQVASEWSSSLNPASAAWPHPERKYRHSFSGQFSTVQFAEGPRLDIYAEAPLIDAGVWGVFLPAAAQLRSNHTTARPGPGEAKGLGFEFEADYFQLQWGKLVAKQWALGALASVVSSETRFDSDGIEVLRSRGETYTFRFGVVHQPIEKLRFGAVVEYAAAPTRTRRFSADPVTGLPQIDPRTGLPVRVRITDATHQILVRTGLTWEYAAGCDFYLDYHGGVFWDDSGELWVHRFPVGIEQMLIRDILYGRVGATIDTRGHTVFTAGLGVALGDRASLDVAYQGAAFPEIRPEFGAADAFVFSLGIGF